MRRHLHRHRRMVAAFFPSSSSSTTFGLRTLRSGKKMCKRRRVQELKGVRYVCAGQCVQYYVAHINGFWVAASYQLLLCIKRNKLTSCHRNHHRSHLLLRRVPVHMPWPLFDYVRIQWPWPISRHQFESICLKPLEYVPMKEKEKQIIISKNSKNHDNTTYKSKLI